MWRRGPAVGVISVVRSRWSLWTAKSGGMLVCAALVILAAADASATPLSFDAVADTFVASDPFNANDNFGTLTFAVVGRSGSPKNEVRRSLLHFDLSALPSNATILHATLELMISRTTRDPLNLGVTVTRLATGFNEFTVTWNTQPANIPVPSNSETMNAMVGDVFAMDVTAVATAVRQSGDPTNAWLRIAPTVETVFDNRNFDFRTKELMLPPDQEARLVIDFTTAGVPLLSGRAMVLAVSVLLLVGVLGMYRSHSLRSWTMR